MQTHIEIRKSHISVNTCIAIMSCTKRHVKLTMLENISKITATVLNATSTVVKTLGWLCRIYSVSKIPDHYLMISDHGMYNIKVSMNLRPCQSLYFAHADLMKGFDPITLLTW